MKNRTKEEIVRAIKRLYEYLKQRGIQPKLHILDNEASKNLKHYITSNDTNYQIALPSNHCTNAAKKCIQVYKNHFMAGICHMDPTCPIALQCIFIPQANITINLIHASRINPKVSVWAFLNGHFVFNRTPLALVRTKCIISEDPKTRGTWDVHGKDAIFIGPALEHYCCYKVYVPTTHAERIGDSVEFFLAYTKMPAISSQDIVAHSAEQLSNALQHAHPATPYHQLGAKQIQALQQLAEIFKTMTNTGNNTYKEYEPPPKKVPTHFKVKEMTPPLRVENSQPHVVEDDNNITRPSPRVAPQHNRPHVIPQCNAVYAQTMCTIPLYYVNHVYNENTSKMEEYRQLIKGKYKEKWMESFANELGHLASGVGKRLPHGTETIKFILFSQVPKNKTVTYGRIVCDMWQHP